MSKGLDGVVQIKHDIVIHGKGKEHDERHKKFLTRLQDHGLTLRIEKCKFGVAEILWFRHLYGRDRMRVDSEKTQIIGEWTRPKDKAGVKSFPQTVQVCKVFMRPGGNKTYADVKLPLRRLTSKSVWFTWTEECWTAFDEMKKLLLSGQVMAHYRDTRLHVDEGPAGIATTLAQKYTVEGIYHSV